MKYRKTSLVEAEQFLPNEGKIPEGVISNGLGDPRKTNYEWIVKTLEGPLIINSGDWVLTGINGEHWPVRKDIFEKTYELAADINESMPKPPLLTDDEIADLWGDKYAGKTYMVKNFARAIETKVRSQYET